MLPPNAVQQPLQGQLPGAVPEGCGHQLRVPVPAPSAARALPHREHQEEAAVLRLRRTVSALTLLVLAMDQFWQYVEDNPKMFNRPNKPPTTYRWGIFATLELVSKYVFPWMPVKTLLGHVRSVKKHGNERHPIMKYMKTGYVEPVKHILIPYDPQMNLYQQPEHKMPTVWVRYLAKTSKRFQKYLNRKTHHKVIQPEGTELDPELVIQHSEKAPFPVDTEVPKHIQRGFVEVEPEKTQESLVASQIYTLVNTSEGTVLVPLDTTGEVFNNVSKPVQKERKVTIPSDPNHCSCCVLLRRICKIRQKLITDYFKKSKQVCPCGSVKYPRITNRLRLVCTYFRRTFKSVYNRLERLLSEAKDVKNIADAIDVGPEKSDPKDLAFVTAFLIRLLLRENKTKNPMLKCRIFNALAKFDDENGDPIKLMEDIDDACDVELADVYKEFLCFLTPEQADKLDKFKDYFIYNCYHGLIDKIEESSLDRTKKRAAFQRMMSLATSELSACELCCELLHCVRDSPDLARYCFHLFPHKRKAFNDNNETGRTEENIGLTKSQMARVAELPDEHDEPEDMLTICNDDEMKRNIRISNGSDNEKLQDNAQKCNGGDEKELQCHFTQISNVDDNVESQDNTRECYGDDNTLICNGSNNLISQGNDRECNGDIESRGNTQTCGDDEKVECDNTRTCNIIYFEGPEDDKSEISMKLYYSSDEESSDTPMEQAEDSPNTLQEKPTSEITSNQTSATIGEGPNDGTDEESNSQMNLITTIKFEAGSDDDNEMAVDENTDQVDIYSQVGVKLETSEWKRDEDKLILEVLKENLSPDEIKDKTIIEIIEEKNLPNMISECLSTKTLLDVKDRISYLLQLLIKIRY
ncbi:uncharacterized protein LOC126977915 isoform X3 [Leptidea sinapis]|uniref:uncharacterized protein LOC126977915 isoform X3 n=1 Tax=Leptidea sinapis TaxID=189913 RepID=UPI0021C3EA1E|nr:uncharacterized protein LOC126977915 isoform X3 [Leptidea sinapis]